MLIAGTESYGRVKKVSGVPIVTRFVMFQFLPIFPIQSYYFLGSGPTETSGVPFLASSQSTQMAAIPLARIDWTSVLIAYGRALFVVLALFGFVFSLITWVASASVHAPPPDEFATYFGYAANAAFLIGTIGGIATYMAPLQSKRDIEIRALCGLILGVAIDPARVTREASEGCVELAEQRAEAIGSEIAKSLRDLVIVRAAGAQGRSGSEVDSMTDKLLPQLYEDIKRGAEAAAADFAARAAQLPDPSKDSSPVGDPTQA